MMLRGEARRSSPPPAGLLAAGLLLLVTAANPVATLARGERFGDEEGGPRGESVGSLDVRLHPREGRRKPPAEMLLTDPRHRRTGWDPRTGERLREIPGSSYEQEGLADDVEQKPGPLTTVLYVANPVPGDYRLEITGREPGEYILEVQGLDRAMNPTRAEVVGRHITAGAVHRYRVHYSSAEGEEVEIETLDRSEKRNPQRLP